MAGAAGGLAGGLWAFAGAELRPGAALVLDAVGFDDRMREAFVVVTGEGRLDEQTLARQGRVRGRDPLPPGGRALLRGRRPSTRSTRSASAC